MSMKEVFLEGNPPWGFRMNGGADAGHPLRISRVNPGSKAESKGVREGDLITSINGQSTKCLTNSESHALLRTVKENLILGLNEDKNASPRRRSREIKSASIISQEKERSESPIQTKGNNKASSNQKRHQRRTRLKHRLKEMFGFKTKDKNKSDDESWVIIDPDLKSHETRSVTDSLPGEEKNGSFIRASSEPVNNNSDEIYDNFEFKTQKSSSYSKKRGFSVSPSSAKRRGFLISPSSTEDEEYSVSPVSMKRLEYAESPTSMKSQQYSISTISIEKQEYSASPSTMEYSVSPSLTTKQEFSVNPSSMKREEYSVSPSQMKKQEYSVSPSTMEKLEHLVNPSSPKRQDLPPVTPISAKKQEFSESTVKFSEVHTKSTKTVEVDQNVGVTSKGINSAETYANNSIHNLQIIAQSPDHSKGKVLNYSNGYDPWVSRISPEQQKSVSYSIVGSPEQSAVETHLSEEESPEVINALPPPEFIEVCNATIMVEDDRESAQGLQIPLITAEIDESDSKPAGQTPNPDYEPVEVTSSVIIYPPYSSTISYYFPQRRYLEAIVEETSDLSENNEEKQEKPWENSELIKKANNIESIPNDWYGSDDGIDTSWRDGKSIEEVSDVPIISDSHSDTDDYKVSRSSIDKSTGDKPSDLNKKDDKVLGKPPLNCVNTYRIDGRTSIKTSVTYKTNGVTTNKFEKPKKELEPQKSEKDSELVGNKVVCKVVKQENIAHNIENKSGGIEKSGCPKSLNNDADKAYMGSMKKEKQASSKNNIIINNKKSETHELERLSCKVVEHQNIQKLPTNSSEYSPTPLEREVCTKQADTCKSTKIESIDSSVIQKKSPKQVKKYTLPSNSVVKNVVSSYYNDRNVSKKDSSSSNKHLIVEKTNIQLNTSSVNPEKDIELVYIDSSDSEAFSNKSNMSVSNRTSISFEKEDEDVVEENDTLGHPYSPENTHHPNQNGHTIKEVITNINQSAKEISDLRCETIDIINKKFTNRKSNRFKSGLMPNLLSPVLPRKFTYSNENIKRRFSYPFTEKDVLKINDLQNIYNNNASSSVSSSKAVSSLTLGKNKPLSNKGSLNSVLPAKDDNVVSKPRKQSLRSCASTPSPNIFSVSSTKEENKSTESIFFDFSEGSVSSESYTLPDVTQENEFLSDVSSDTIKYIRLPASSPKFVSMSPVEVSDLHKKFVERRGYHEASPIMKRKHEESKTPEPDLIALSKCKEKSEQAYTPELLAEAANLLALRKYHESRQNKMKQNKSEKVEENKNINVNIKDVENDAEHKERTYNTKSKITINQALKLPEVPKINEKIIEEKKSNKSVHTENETVGKSRLLELFQKLESKSSNSECTMPEPFPYWLILGEGSDLNEVSELTADSIVTVSVLKKDKSNCENDTTKEVDIPVEELNENGSLKTFKSETKESSTVSDTSTTILQVRPASLPAGEIFQRKMYEEYLNKMAELAERRNLKVIKISNVSSSVTVPSDNQPLESEFMMKLKERNEKLGIVIDDDSGSDVKENDEPVKEDLPKHLKELMEITEECGDIVGKGGLLVEIDEALSPERKGFLTAKGVWSPAQTPEAERKKFDFSNEIKEDKEEEENKEPQPPVWTPRSAGASPTLERKFRTVNFQSPPPTRKEIKTPIETPELPKDLPVDPDKDSKSRLTSSSSENSTLSSSLRLPAAQNPTITLLQKAREGQIPRGAQYLEEQPPLVGQNEIIYSVKKEEFSEDHTKKIVELGPRKIEGIGPTTREGIPTVLRSEVKEDNQQRWYKRMYDSLHKADYDKDFVTVKYKTKRRGQYPFSYSGGYASEPERIGYDSDASLSKYATLDRRKIRNKENDFTTSTMPRNRYGPGVKYAVNVYKNQPGKIEDYEPGHSSIADHETKQWWDEVMDIFDGELNDQSRSNHSATRFGGKPYTYSLKDTGYESDSTLVFKRRENNMSGQLLSPSEQKMAYKVIQKGGEVPLHGLRKAAPERPKEDSEIEYFPLSPTLTRIRVHKKFPKPKEKVYYPMSDDVVYSTLKRTSRTVIPSPPRRESSKYNSTLKLYAHVGTSRSPEVKSEYFKDKVVTRLPRSESIDVKIEKSHGKIKNTSVKLEQPRTHYGVVKPKKEVLRQSPELKAPGEVKRALKDSKMPAGTMVKSSTTLYSSAKNKKPKEDKSLKVTVAISTKGKEILSPSSTSSKSDVRKSPVLSKSISKGKSSLETKPISPPILKGTRPSSRSSIASTTISPDIQKKTKKETVFEQKKKREKKPETIIKIVDKNKDEDKKKIKKKQENGKKKNGSKKKDKENIPQDISDKHDEIIPLPAPPKKQEFFQKLLLRESNSPRSSVASTTLSRTPSVLDRVKKFSEPGRFCFKSEPSLRNLNVYLSQKRPVSESRFRSLERTPSRSVSPYYGTYDFYEKLDKYDRHNNVWDYSLCYGTAHAYESVKGRSSSEPPHTSPTLSQDVCDNVESVSPSTSRSPSCRRIRRPTSRAIETISGLRRKFRSKSLNEADKQSHMGSTSSLSMSQFTDHDDYRTYFFELLHSTRKSDKFKELHKFYSSLERMAELEKTTSNTDLRPRLKGEEVIDFDRWKQLRNKEKAEKELSSLYEKLKDDQREKGFLFQPKEPARWSGDRGLRHKEKSVEDLRSQYQRLVEKALSDKKQDVDPSNDVYKPLWRGSSVANLASSLTSVTGSKRGRPIREPNQSLIKPPAKKDKDIGSRLWSSLSMEQVNALKNQLTEIYSTVSNLKHERIKKMRQNIEDYEINVTDLNREDSPLHVRCNSLVSTNQLYSPAVKKRIAKRQECMKANSIGTLPQYKATPLSENEKRKLSMSLSAEVKERIKKKKHGSLVIPRETLGAVAAIKGSKKIKSPCLSETSPRTCYSLLSDESTDRNDEKNKDFLLVLTPKEQAHDTKKIIDDWGSKEYARMVQTTSSSSSSASTVIHLGYKDDMKVSSNKLGELSQSQSDLRQESDTYKTQRKTLYSSQSFSDLKDLFGEKHASTYATLPLRNIKKPCYSSTDSLYKSISPDPMKYYRAYLNVVKAGDVRKLKDKFESYDDIYNLRKEHSSVQKRYQSDPDLTRDFLSRKGGELSKVIVKGQEVGDVQWLRRRYEPRKVSPLPFKVEDRYMPHINVISKTATLQQRAHTPPCRMEVPKTGNVERLKHQFEKDGMSLLGQMYTSTPEITELRDIAPYLECEWIAHQNPRRSETRKKIRPRPASASPIRQSILKQTDIFANQEFNPEIHRPVCRYQPEPWHPKPWARPTVTFKEPLGNPIPTPPRDGTSRQRIQESPHRYVESEVNIHYKSPVRREAKVAWPEDELAQRQAEIMRRIYQEQKRTKYLNELHDMYSRRHADNLLPSQKSPIPLNRYDDFPVEVQPPRPRDRTPEPKLVARALYNFVGQTSRELSFRRGDIIYVRRQIDKNWYEGEHNAMIGLFPFNYVEIIPYDGIRTLPKKASEGQARAKFNFQAQTHLELSLVKGELVLLTRRVDENWFEGRIGNRKGIFPVSYVEVLVEPGERAVSPGGNTPTKPIVAPASHSVMLNGAKDLGQQHYQPPRPAIYTSSSLPPSSKINDISLVNQTLHIDTQSDPVPYRVMYNYRPQNEDELELKEGDIVYVMEKCDDGWYVGSLHRNGQFGTFPGNYVERIQ